MPCSAPVLKALKPKSEFAVDDFPLLTVPMKQIICSIGGGGGGDGGGGGEEGTVPLGELLLGSSKSLLSK